MILTLWALAIAGVLIIAGLSIRASRSSTPPPSAASPGSGSVEEPPVVWRSSDPQRVPDCRTKAVSAEALRGPLGRILVSAEIMRTVDSAYGKADSWSLLPSLLCDQGLIEASMSFTRAGQITYVCYYPDSSLEDSAHFAVLQRECAARGLPCPISLSVNPLPQAADLGAVMYPVYHPAGSNWFQDLDAKEREALHGEWAMWWKTPGDEDFLSSATTGALDQYYSQLDRIESVLLGILAKTISLTAEEVPEGGCRLPLPEEEISLPIRGPEDKILVLSISSEKGIRFLFPVASTDQLYRERFLRLFADSVGELRSEIERQGIELDPESDTRPLFWWKLLKTSTRADQMQEPAHASTKHLIGLLRIDAVIH